MIGAAHAGWKGAIGGVLDTTVAAMIDLIVMKATDEGGDRLFTASEDKYDLMGEETSVISEISGQMFAEIESVEDQEKN